MRGKTLRTDDILLISSVFEMGVIQQFLTYSQKPPPQKKRGVYTVSFTLDAPEFGFQLCWEVIRPL